MSMSLLNPTLGAGDLISHVIPHDLFTLGPITFTNHMLMALVSAVVLVLVMLNVAKRIAVRADANTVDDYMTKGRVANIFEVILIFLREEMARPALGKLTDRYIGYIWTTFFFILFCNVLGLVPIGSLLGFVDPHLVHFGGTATGNIAVTATLAVISFVMILFVGIREHGLRYFLHFAPVPLWPLMKGASPGLMPVALLLILLEIVGAFIKPFALCMRLFANMLAGHLVLAALVGMIFLAKSAAVQGGVAIPVVLGATAMSGLELFVAFLQAYIFTFLTVLFIAQGAVHEHDDHPHEPHDEHEHLPLNMHQASETEPDVKKVAVI